MNDFPSCTLCALMILHERLPSSLKIDVQPEAESSPGKPPLIEKRHLLGGTFKGRRAMQGRSAKFITWTENFCTAYSDFALLAAKAFLYTALALAVLLVVLAAIKAFTAQPVVNPAAQAGGNAITGLIESLKGFVVSLSDAPTWLALFAGGVLLLWMAGNSVPEYCEPAEPSPNTRSGAGGSGAPQPPRPAT